MKRITMSALSLFMAMPLCLAVVSPAAAGQVHPNQDNISGRNYVTNYNDFLTDPYDGGTGTAIKFDFSITNDSAQWDFIGKGQVTSSTFSNPTLLQTYGGDPLVELDNFGDFDENALGTVGFDAVMRPYTDGNYFVEHSLGNGNYRLVSVYATNNEGGGNVAYCLTSDGASQQAIYSPCGDSGQTLAITGI
jgi:hypothetical protein